MLNPLVVCTWLTVFLIFLQLVLSAITTSVSWNDRFWPLIPAIHAAFFAIGPILFRRPPATILDSVDSRLAVMMSVVFIWSIRLTLHAVRRGVYKSGEVDYRYRWLRTNIIKHPVLYALFYIFVVCIFFTVLMTLVVMPMYFAWLVRFHEPFNYIDAVALVLTLASISLETMSDMQQQAFHSAKSAAHQKRVDALQCRESAQDLDIDDGFLQSGLFAYCRHPNFFAELSMWFSFYLFSIAAGAPLINWTITGPSFYLVLFHGSTTVTEHLSAQKYQRYINYQRRVPHFIPSPFCKPRFPVQYKVGTRNQRNPT